MQSNYSDDFLLKKLNIAMQYTHRGFLCFTTPRVDGQYEAVKLIKKRTINRPVVYYDCAVQKQLDGLSFINSLVDDNPDSEVFIVYNFQYIEQLAKGYKFFHYLNFSRDPWANLGKLFVLGFVDKFENKLAKEASDFYTFFLSRLRLNICGTKIYGVQTKNPFKRYTYWYAHNYKTDVENLERSIDYYSENNDLFSKSNANTILGIILTENNKLDEAESQYINALGYYNAIDEKYLLYQTNILLAELKQKQADCDAAEEYLTKASDIATSEKFNHAPIYHNLGIAAEERGDLETAAAQYNKSLSISLEQEDLESLAATYHQLGNVAEKQNNLESAIEWYNKSLELSKKMQIKQRMADTYHQLGMVWQDRNDYEAAKEQYNLALSVLAPLDNDYYKAKTLYQLGTLERELGSVDQGLGSVERELGSADQGQTYQGHACIENAMGFFQQALEIFERHNDQYSATVAKRAIGELETDYTVTSGDRGRSPLR